MKHSGGTSLRLTGDGADYLIEAVGDTTPARALADAQLWKASPDLLAACDAAYDQFKVPSPLRRQLEAAIAKAKP